MKLNKALFWLLHVDLLFYRKIRKELEAMGFVVNPYEPCVANRMVNGKQQRVTWHVNDLKISHVDEVENTLLIHKILRIYSKNLTCLHGKVHDYLGMDLDFREDYSVKISMIKYTKKIFVDFP